MVGHTGFLLGIVAAVMAIVVAYVKQSLLGTTTLSLLSLSLVMFLFAAERFSESLDFDDQRRYLAAINTYNLGVTLLLWGMAALMLVFEYHVPMLIMVLASSWWVREIIRAMRVAGGGRKPAVQK
jgi:hypothetical protein